MELPVHTHIIVDVEDCQIGIYGHDRCRDLLENSLRQILIAGVFNVHP